MQQLCASSQLFVVWDLPQVPIISAPFTSHLTSPHARMSSHDHARQAAEKSAGHCAAAPRPHEPFIARHDGRELRTKSVPRYGRRASSEHAAMHNSATAWQADYAPLQPGIQPGWPGPGHVCIQAHPSGATEVALYSTHSGTPAKAQDSGIWETRLWSRPSRRGLQHPSVVSALTSDTYDGTLPHAIAMSHARATALRQREGAGAKGALAW